MNQTWTQLDDSSICTNINRDEEIWDKFDNCIRKRIKFFVGGFNSNVSRHKIKNYISKHVCDMHAKKYSSMRDPDSVIK